MRRTLTSILSALVAIGLSATAAFAGKVHINSISFSASSPLNASGTLAGLGNADIFVILEASGIGTATCTNKGGTEAPGQNPVEVDVMGIAGISAELIDNGTTPFSVSTADPEPPTAKEAGCPNNNWTVTDFFVDWQSATLTVEDANTGEILLVADFTCTTTPTDVSCTLVTP